MFRWQGGCCSIRPPILCAPPFVLFQALLQTPFLLRHWCNSEKRCPYNTVCSLFGKTKHIVPTYDPHTYDSAKENRSFQYFCTSSKVDKIFTNSMEGLEMSSKLGINFPFTRSSRFSPLPPISVIFPSRIASEPPSPPPPISRPPNGRCDFHIELCLCTPQCQLTQGIAAATTTATCAVDDDCIHAFISLNGDGSNGF